MEVGITKGITGSWRKKPPLKRECKLSKSELAAWDREHFVKYQRPSYKSTEEQRAREKLWRDKNRDKINARKREWVRKHRAEGKDPWYNRQREQAAWRKKKGLYKVSFKGRKKRKPVGDKLT